MAREKFVIHGPASAETVKINETMMMINKINDERHQSSIGSHHKTCLNLTILSLMMSRCQSSRNDKRAPTSALTMPAFHPYSFQYPGRSDGESVARSALRRGWLTRISRGRSRRSTRRGGRQTLSDGRCVSGDASLPTYVCSNLWPRRVYRSSPRDARA